MKKVTWRQPMPQMKITKTRKPGCDLCGLKDECDSGVVLTKVGNETISYKCDGTTMEKLGTFTNLPYIKPIPDTIPAPIGEPTPTPTPPKQSDLPDNVKRFRRIAQDLANLYSRKNEDYGDSFGRSVEKYGLISALTRMSDKFNRLESLILAHGDAKVSDESLDDTLRDLAAYCIMTLVAREQQKEKENRGAEVALDLLNELAVNTVSKATDNLASYTDALTKLGGGKC